MIIAIRDPGILSVTFGQSSMMTIAAAPTAVAVQLMVEIFVA